ncbi:MAG: 4'-phosphopantetheinyl transferase family protein [Bdellovibrionales bacterium]
MSLFDELIQLAKSQDQNLILDVEENLEWRSGSLDHRLKLRTALAKYLSKKFHFENFDNILDLKKLPEFKHGFISISHCPQVGVFAVSNRQLGLDIEVASRVKPEVVERICHKNELQLTNNLPAIWSAKEALFKAHRNFKVISDTHILEWKVSHNGIFSFSDNVFSGWVGIIQGITVSLAIKKSSI